MEFLGPLPCFVVTLAEIQHDFPHIRFGPGNELRVPPPEATVEIPHGTPGHLHHLRGDGSTICHRCGGLSVHKATLARSNLRLKHPNSTVGTHLRRRHAHQHSSFHAVHAEIRASSRLNPTPRSTSTHTALFTSPSFPASAGPIPLPPTQQRERAGASIGSDHPTTRRAAPKLLLPQASLRAMDRSCCPLISLQPCG